MTREIVLIGREAGSGTRDGFESITDTKDTCKYRQELTSTGDVITTVSQNPNAIGYASLAAVKDSVKALTVGGVAPDRGDRQGRQLRRPASVRPCDQERNASSLTRRRSSSTSRPPQDAVGTIIDAGAVAANG